MNSKSYEERKEVYFIRLKLNASAKQNNYKKIVNR